MKFCPFCGAQIDEKAVICVHCGRSLNQAPAAQNNVEGDTNAILYGVLGALIPLAGLIMFIMWKNTYPQRAKYAGIGALIGWIIGIIVGAIIGAAVGASSYYYF